MILALKYVHNVFHVSLLKPLHSGSDRKNAPVAILVDMEVEYKVDSIIGHQISRLVR